MSIRHSAIIIILSLYTSDILIKHFSFQQNVNRIIFECCIVQLRKKAKMKIEIIYPHHNGLFK